MVLTAARELDDDEVDDGLLRCIRRTYVHTPQCYIIYMPPYNYYIYAYNGYTPPPYFREPVVSYSTPPGKKSDHQMTSHC